MKKNMIVAILAVFIFLLSLGSLSWGAVGSCTQATYAYGPGSFIKVVLTCTGGTAGDAGTVSDTVIASDVMDLLRGFYYLYTVKAYPTAGGTAPNVADVFVLTSELDDLLGSADGGTTANKGANLIHATLTRTTFPYSNYASVSYASMILTTAITVRTSNQATASANWKIELHFGR